MQISIMPVLTPENIRELDTWLTGMFNHATHEVTRERRLTCASKLSLYYSDMVHPVIASTSFGWTVAGHELKCYIGIGTSVSISDKLAVLLALKQYLPAPTAALETAAGDAVLRYLLTEYNTLRSDALTTSTIPATGLAFNVSTSQGAALIGDEWMLPNGEPVDVSGEEWTVAAFALPAIPVLSGPLVEVTAPVYTVGQRVHYHRIPGIRSTPGTGVVIHVVADGATLPDGATLGATLHVRAESGGTYSFGTRDIFPEFTVGQHVRFFRIPSYDDYRGPMTGVIVRSSENSGSESRFAYFVQVDDGSEVYIYPELLSLEPEVQF